MSSAQTVRPPSQAGRRFHARRRIEGLAYVEFGPDNGAILIDLGEGGLGFQSVMPVTLNQALLFKFKLPSEANYIEGCAEVAWRNESGKGGGLRFLELSGDANSQIRQWTGVLAAPEASAARPKKNAEASSAEESATNQEIANAAEESSAPVEQEKSAAAESTESSPEGESSESSSSQIEELLAAVEAAEDTKAAEQKFAVEQEALSQPPAIPEFTIELVPASEPHEVTSSRSEWAAPAAAPNMPAKATGMGSAVAHEPTVPAAPPAASPARPARASGSDSTSSAPAQKRLRKPAPAMPERSSVAYDGQPAFRGSFTPEAQKPAQSTWESTSFGEADQLEPNPALLSQGIKIAIGVAAGACLVLALFWGVPALRSHVQGTANAKSANLSLAGAPAFQVEVADLNNRRWILRSGGDAGSPFGDTPSRRETQSASARSESAKSSRSEDAGDSGDAAQAPKSKLPKPGELVLSRPRAAASPAASAQLAAPSIFDGITPPIGSVSDRLAAGGPAAPGIVPPESQPGIRTSALESAVLVQRVAPVYPPLALAGRVQGDVLVNAMIDTDGVPKNLKVIKGDQRLVAAALAAISQWRYRPATLAGRSIPTQTVVTVTFQLK